MSPGSQNLRVKRQEPDAEEDVRRSRVDDIALVFEPGLLHRASNPPQAPRSFTASGPVYPIEELENRAWALLFAPTRMAYLVPERLANVKEVGIFYAVSRYKVIDRGTSSAAMP